MLLDEDILTEGEISIILTKARENKVLFIGQVGILLGYYDNEILNKYLKKQALQKVDAAVKDIDTIKATKKNQDTPSWLRANWGNNGVSKNKSAITKIDGAISAANVAQNIVMIANTNPNLITEKTVQVISNLRNAVKVLCEEYTTTPDSIKDKSWINDVKIELKSIVTNANHQPKDNFQQNIDLDDFILERLREIEESFLLTM